MWCFAFLSDISVVVQVFSNDLRRLAIASLQGVVTTGGVTLEFRAACFMRGMSHVLVAVVGQFRL